MDPTSEQLIITLTTQRDEALRVAGLLAQALINQRAGHSCLREPIKKSGELYVSPEGKVLKLNDPNVVIITLLSQDETGLCTQAEARVSNHR